MTADRALGLMNYWVVIGLMMVGFYIVIGQRNLIKSILGLNIFQTSVFLLYITMGKRRGGTAPIVPPDRVEGHASHGGGHADATSGHSVAHAEATASAAADSHGNATTPGGLHADVDHHLPAEGHVGDAVETAAASTMDHAASAGEIVYSHPLPSVLMLTAIVVGIATTALALALIVRIREEYGTIEEDEILALDDAEAEGEHTGRIDAAACGLDVSGVAGGSSSLGAAAP